MKRQVTNWESPNNSKALVSNYIKNSYNSVRQFKGEKISNRFEKASQQKKIY